MMHLDPVTELDNALEMQRLLAEQLGEPSPSIHERYELLRTLGRGANGLVCEARDRQLDRAVALKLVPLRAPRAARDAEREARTLARFDHPNIVRIHDVGRTTHVGSHAVELVFVVMELLKGTNLRHWSSVPHSAEEIRAVFLAAGEGLAAAHDQAIVHGDFKPENVVIDDRGHVRVVDFGLARWTADPPPDSAHVTNRTHTQGPRGTVGYIAPEVFDARADARSDQYSFAVSLWEMLTGHPPYELTAEGLPVPTPPRGAHAISRELRGLLVRGFALDPSARHASMRELLAQLRSTSLVDAPPPPLPSHRPAILAAAAVGAAAIVGMLAFTSFDAPKVQASPPAKSPLDSSLPASTPAPTPTPTAPSSAQSVPSSPPAPPDCPEVAEIVGRWDLTTFVVWADAASLLGARGYYSVEVLPDQGCRAAFLMRKGGDSGKDRYAKIYQDRIVADVRRSADGSIEADLDAWLGADKPLDGSAAARRAGLHYRYSLRWRDDRFAGDWEMFHQDTATPEMRGLLSGARDGVGHTVARQLGAATCESQCRIRCPGPAAVDRCTQACAADGDAPPRDCGAPAPDFQPPTATYRAAMESIEDPAPTTDACLKVAQRLSGTWKLWQRSVTADALASSEVTLTSAGCSLSGHARDADGSVRAVHGHVDDKGVWRLQTVDRPDEPVWALVGGDPAFGVGDRGGAILAAQKL